MARKPCGQNGRTQCQTKSKYDRYAVLRARGCPSVVHRRWPMSVVASRIECVSQTTPINGRHP